MSLGERLREARGRRSLRAAARALGVDPMTLRAWEGGFKVPRPDKADMLAMFLGVSRAEVLGLMGILTPGEVEVLRPSEGAELSTAVPLHVRAAAT